MAMNPMPGVAVAGCGYWGKNLVRNFSELGSLRMICDPEESRLRQAAEAYGVEGVRQFEDVLKRPEIGAVVIAAPASQHFSLARRALKSGKDVMVEKPLALHAGEGEELVELAERLGRILMVGHLLLYHPAVLELRRLIRSGELGRIQYVYACRANWGKLRSEENILWSFAPHDLSALLYLLDEEPSAVAAHGGKYLNREIADITLSTFEFPSGVKAHIFVSWLHPFKEQKLVIVGGRQLAVFDDTETDRKLVLYPHRIDWVDRLPVALRGESLAVPLPDEEPLRAECQHFLDCVRERRRPRTDGESGVRVLRVLEACEKSLNQPLEPLRENGNGRNFMLHATAVADQPVEIGAGTRIWHFSHVMKDAVIGRNCILGQNVHVASGVRIGDNVKIQNNVSLYDGVELEDDVFCGPSMVFTNVINPRSRVDRKNEFRKTLVKRGASLGANSTIVCGVTIGRHSFVAAGAVVTQDVPDFALVMGVPARQAGWMCECGTRLELDGDASVCASCRQSYVLGDGGVLVEWPLTMHA
jgi:UDP-2-acetamido-3-amino-2,3-dideoxy-glucuronate N-acetyltransferase